MRTNRRFDQEPNYWQDEPKMNPKLGCLIVAAFGIIGIAFWVGIIYIFA